MGKANTVRGAALALLAAAVLFGASATAGERKLPKPSENRGRTGQYNDVKTKFAGCLYHVYVPTSYADDNPAGIHLFFHGQSSCSTNDSFERWATPFLESQNLIGINMRYPDGDNGKDTKSKAEAGLEAVLQIQADYHIVVGRGAVGSFSGGGLPHLTYFKSCGAGAKGPTAEWPFIHNALYDSNYRGSGVLRYKFTGFVGLGEKEWNLAKLGEDMSARAGEFFRDAQKNCPDMFFNYTIGKDHCISTEDVERSAAQFERLDLATQPFMAVCCDDDKPLQSAIGDANQLKLAAAMAKFEAAQQNAALPEAVKARAQKLAARVNDRADRVRNMVIRLAKNDKPLLSWYGKAYLDQLKGTPQEKEAKDAYDASECGKAKGVQKDFIKNFSSYLNASGRLNKDKEKDLQKYLEEAGAGSTIGQMCTRLLDFK